MAKKRNLRGGLVYSTDPDIQVAPPRVAEAKTLPPARQQLRVRLETRHRAGKAMTVVTGFIGSDGDLEELGRRLKGHCGCGGSTKDGEILVQGDQREKVVGWLAKSGYVEVEHG